MRLSLDFSTVLYETITSIHFVLGLLIDLLDICGESWTLMYYLSIDWCIALQVLLTSRQTSHNIHHIILAYSKSFIHNHWCHSLIMKRLLTSIYQWKYRSHMNLKGQNLCHILWIGILYCIIKVCTVIIYLFIFIYWSCIGNVLSNLTEIVNCMLYVLFWYKTDKYETLTKI
jgi:hypothetical protein